MGYRYTVHPLAKLTAGEVPAGKYKVVHLIRHAQGQHNEAVSATGSEEEYKNWAWADSRLTELGRAQASSLRPSMCKHTVDVVLVSPLSRALLTAKLAIPEGPPFVVLDAARERIGTHPCDQRRSRAAIAADFPGVDLSDLAHEDDEKWTPEREPWADVVKRAEFVLDVLRARSETHIAVVTHNDFLTALLYDSSLRLADESLRVKFGNAQHLPVVLTWEEANVAEDGGALNGAAALQ